MAQADRAHVVMRLRALARSVYRLRVGRYRVIYKVFDREQMVLIGKVAPRAERTYKDLEDLF